MRSHSQWWCGAVGGLPQWSRDEASLAHLLADAVERVLQGQHTDPACAASLVHAASTEARSFYLHMGF